MLTITLSVFYVKQFMERYMTGNMEGFTRTSTSFLYHGDLGTSNLNHLNGTQYGVYSQEKSGNLFAGLNYPEDSAGSLLVLPTLDIGCTQEYRPYSSNALYRRRYYMGAIMWEWSAWIEEYNSENLPVSSGGGFTLSAGIVQLWLHPLPPEGWLICDGSPFNKAAYPVLGNLFPEGVLPTFMSTQMTTLSLKFIIRAL
uniref:tail fiber protein n=2 Tax=Serratia TaxID=613 RepID=UPI001F4BFB92|nr:tail fiber protein [Serratia proteamaculans]